jgi:hypothetical protein
VDFVGPRKELYLAVADLESLFPKLKDVGYERTSPESAEYNCVAWAVRKQDQWWESAPGYYWPVAVSVYSQSIESVVIALKSLDFSVCENVEVEVGYEKVAIYGQDGEYTHVARQLPSGKWTSKIGGLEDIEHGSLEALVGIEYGIVAKILKRKYQQ